MLLRTILRTPINVIPEMMASPTYCFCKIGMQCVLRITGRPARCVFRAGSAPLVRSAGLRKALVYAKELPPFHPEKTAIFRCFVQSFAVEIYVALFTWCVY